MRAPLVNSQESTIMRANQEETAAGKLYDRACRKTIDRSGVHGPAKFSFQAARLHKQQAGAAHFQERQSAHGAKAQLEKVTPG